MSTFFVVALLALAGVVVSGETEVWQVAKQYVDKECKVLQEVILTPMAKGKCKEQGCVEGLFLQPTIVSCDKRQPDVAGLFSGTTVTAAVYEDNTGCLGVPSSISVSQAGVCLPESYNHDRTFATSRCTNTGVEYSNFCSNSSCVGCEDAFDPYGCKSYNYASILTHCDS